MDYSDDNGCTYGRCHTPDQCGINDTCMVEDIIHTAKKLGLLNEEKHETPD